MKKGNGKRVITDSFVIAIFLEKYSISKMMGSLNDPLAFKGRIEHLILLETGRICSE